MQAYINTTELPDSDMELNNIMRVLNDPNFSLNDFTGSQKLMEELTPEEKEKRLEEKKIFDEKYKESEEHISDIKTHFEGFNSQTLKMLQFTPSKIISEMAVRLFVGSRDIPKHVPKAMQLLKLAREKDKDNLSFKEQKDIEFFEIMLNRLNNQSSEDPNSFWDVNERLKQLAEEGHPNAKYVYGSELLQL